MVTQKSKVIVIAVVAVLIVSCAPPTSTPTATQTLPPPLIRVTRAIPPSPKILPAPTATPPAQISIPKSDIVQMAEELFGERQILSISIPALNIESEVLPVGWRVNFEEDLQSGAFEWDNPNEKVGWIVTSALPDEAGNVALYGHNNIYGKIFQNLYQLKEGEKIYLQTKNQRWEYEARYILLLPILGADAAQVKQYQKYLQPTADARVTLISCYPPASNTHRVVVIGK